MDINVCIYAVICFGTSFALKEMAGVKDDFNLM
jgi:hypothetical protein